MVDCITLTVPANEGALMVVRLTAAGVAARSELDLETMEDVKTAVYEACYAMTMQKFTPEWLAIRFAPGKDFAVDIRALGAWTETGGREPDLALCRAVLSTMIPHVRVDMDGPRICGIELRR